MFFLLVFTLSFTFSFLSAAPLSPESIANLRASGELPTVAERFSQAVQRGVERPSLNILDNLRRIHRDNPQETVLRIPIILVDFRDNAANQNQHPRDYYTQLLFSLDAFEPGSLREYYRENSYGEVDIQGEVVGWVRSAQNYSYYVNRMNGLGNYPMNSQGLTREAALLANNGLDFSQFDNDDDGVVDALVIIHAGPGAEMHNGNIDMIWSHAWGLNENWVRLDGVFINQFVVLPEDGSVGIFSHELGHALFGLPDLYDRNYESTGIGIWSVMSFGCWNGRSGDSPAHFDAWCKQSMGFASPENLEHNRFVWEIPPVESESAIYRLWTEGEAGAEYYLIENRQRLGFDAALPSAGLLIYHVDDEVATQNDRPWWPGHEDRGHCLVALEQADGDWDLEQNANRGDDGDPFPGSSGNDVFNRESVPSSRSYGGANTQVEVRFISEQNQHVTANLRVNERPPALMINPMEINDNLIINNWRYHEVVNLANQGEEILQFRTNVEILTEFQRVWVSVRPDSGRIAPQGNLDLIISFTIWEEMEDGEYDAELHILSNDPDTPEAVIFIQIDINERNLPPLEHFTDFHFTDGSHLVELAEVYIDGDEAPHSSEIGVSTPNGGLAGGICWNPEGRVFLDAWGDDPQTEEVDGFHPGERMTFRTWDIEAEQEWTAWPTWLEGPEVWQDDGLSTITLEAYRLRTFAIPLHQSWNLVSTPVPPPNRDMLQIWQSIVQRGRLMLVKDHFGRFYSPEFGYNGLVDGWNPLYGYQVRMSNPDTLYFTGEPLPGNRPIYLREGWSMASYLPDFGQTAPVALANIREVLLLAKDENGRFYAPAQNFSNMGSLRQGLGYLIKVSQEIDLVWNTDRQLAAVIELNPSEAEDNIPIRTHHFPMIAPTDRNQSLLLKSEAAMRSWEVAAISDRGETFGSAVIDSKEQTGMAVWGDDPTTAAREGFQEGEHFRILAWYPKNDVEFKVLPKVVTNCESLVFQTDGLVEVELEAGQLIPTQLQLTEAYPNPFNAQTSVQCYLPDNLDINLFVTDLRGREVARLASGKYQAGGHKFVWNSQDRSSGLHFIILRVKDKIQCRKAILIK
ncbi:MAG: M6 family metalloprotease domain-containing protein [Calditrichota bacterium]